MIAYQIENEYTGRSAADLQYLANLEQQAHADGINVPFTFNQCCGGPFYTSGTGAVNISGPDNYPLGFNCADTSHFGQPSGYPTQPGEPLYLPEFQGGSFDGWSHRTTLAPLGAVYPPRTWLASTGWRRAGGPIDLHEKPSRS